MTDINDLYLIKKKPDEPMFVLLARDFAATIAIEAWLNTRRGHVQLLKDCEAPVDEIAHEEKHIAEVEAILLKFHNYFMKITLSYGGEVKSTDILLEPEPSVIPNYLAKATFPPSTERPDDIIQPQDSPDRFAPQEVTKSWPDLPGEHGAWNDNGRLELNPEYYMNIERVSLVLNEAGCPATESFLSCFSAVDLKRAAEWAVSILVFESLGDFNHEVFVPPRPEFLPRGGSMTL